MSWSSKRKYLLTYVCSLYQHLLTSQPPTKEDCDRLNRRFFRFVWGGYDGHSFWIPPPNLPWQVARRPFMSGGLFLPDAEIRMKTAWVRVLSSFIIGDANPEQRKIWFGLLAYFLGFSLQKIAPNSAKTTSFLHYPFRIPFVEPPWQVFNFLRKYHAEIDLITVKPTTVYFALADTGPVPLPVSRHSSVTDWLVHLWPKQNQ